MKGYLPLKSQGGIIDDTNPPHFLIYIFLKGGLTMRLRLCMN